VASNRIQSDSTRHGRNFCESWAERAVAELAYHFHEQSKGSATRCKCVHETVAADSHITRRPENFAEHKEPVVPTGPRRRAEKVLVLVSLCFIFATTFAFEFKLFCSSAIQGKGINIHSDHKKAILNKLFKGSKIKNGIVTPATYQTVNSSFNEQLMNQTNFGFNPARQTIVSTPNSTAHPKDQGNIMFMDPMNSDRRRELNTQKRNRTQTIQIESPIAGNINAHQRGGSLNIQELYSHYHSKTKSGVNAAQAVIASNSVNPVSARGGPQALQSSSMVTQNNFIAS
jgi:hypothetical protein